MAKTIWAVAALILAASPLAAAAPFTALDKTGPDTAVRHVEGAELADTLRKAKKPGDFYVQAMLAKGARFQMMETVRDKDGQAEVHAEWSDHIIVQDGQARFVTGGTAVNAVAVAPGERRGTSIKGGTSMTMKVGDYFFVPAGTPHQMLVAPGQHIRFVAVKTHK